VSAKITLAAFAALLTVLSTQAPAFARSNSPTAHNYRFKQAIKRFKARVPSDAFGSIGYPAAKSFGRSSNDFVSGVYFVGRDPDPNIRFSSCATSGSESP
jgi:hypothetical protein